MTLPKESTIFFNLICCYRLLYVNKRQKIIIPSQVLNLESAIDFKTETRIFESNYFNLNLIAVNNLCLSFPHKTFKMKKVV